MAKTEFTDRQKLFCAKYLIHFNASKAALEAGYSKKTAGQQGHNLLQHPHIQKYLAERTTKIFNKLDITPEKVLREAARLLFQDVRQFYDENGALIPVHLLNDDAAAVIAGIEVEELYERIEGDKLPVGQLKKIKRFGKDKAMELLFRHLNLLKDENANPLNVNANVFLSKEPIVFE